MSTTAFQDTLALVKRLEGGGPRMVTAIHPEDEMFLYVLDHPERAPNPQTHYFSGGERMLTRLHDLLGKLDLKLADTRRFLEFACGYGRFTRHLVRVLPPSRITVSDLSHKAVDFQRATFGVKGVYSHLSPDDVKFADQFDLIFVASLFSHLPDAAFGAWVRRLYDALDEGGTLLFSTHGPSCLPADVAMPERGIIYHKASESRTHSADDYGTSYVTEEYVAQSVREHTGQDVALRVERGLFNIQDVYAVRKPRADEPVRSKPGRSADGSPASEG
ncbi:MAG: class I SAM-dependent methyltransferase [Arenimonas sp.]